jgi:hypothetical protein
VSGYDTLANIRAEIGEDCRKVLGYIWRLFLEKGEWPSSRRVHSDLGKEFVTTALAKTNGSVVTEFSQNSAKYYRLVGIGPLLTEDGVSNQHLLLRYFELLRTLYRKAPEQRVLANAEIEKALALSQKEGRVLYHLIIIGYLNSNSASFGEEGWSVGVLDDSEDFPEGPLDRTLEQLLLRSYDPNYLIFQADQIKSMSQPRKSEPSTSQDSRKPLVFISYSHDSPEHKRWVRQLADNLRSDGIDILIDVKVRPGEDLAFFMEQSIGKADRVLMICTAAYVRKMDGRTGGVGYETVISTGELMKNQHTAKFIPIVRQDDPDPVMPRLLQTRSRIDLSEGSKYNEEYERLRDDLLEASIEPQGSDGLAAEDVRAKSSELDGDETTSSNTSKTSADIASIYQQAQSLVRSNDFSGWKDLLRQAKNEAHDRLSKIKQSLSAGIPHTPDRVPAYLHLWHDNYQAVYAIALAGILSRKPHFNDQIFLIEELLRPPHWSGTGHSIITEMPESTVFLFQILHGAACVESGQLDIGLNLARERFKITSENEPERVFLIHSFSGWFNGSCFGPWQFLRDLSKSWPWLERVFGSSDTYLASVCAYYCTLNLIELANLIKQGFAFTMPIEHFDVPPMFNFIDRAIAGQAYRMLATPGKNIKATWLPFGVTYDQMKSHWPYWTQQCYSWLGSVYNQGVRKGQMIHDRLFEDVHQSSE